MRTTQENDRNSFAQTSIDKREEEKLKNSSLSTIEKDTALKVQKGNHLYTKRGVGSMLEEIVISIPRMNCNGCLKKVTNILQSLPGVAIIASDLAAKTIQLHYRSEHISMTQIQAALEEAHYPIEGMQPGEAVRCFDHTAPPLKEKLSYKAVLKQ